MADEQKDLTAKLAEVEKALADSQKEIEALKGGVVSPIHGDSFKKQYEETKAELEKVRADLQKQFEDAQKELVDSKAEVTKVRQQRRRERFIKMVQELPDLPGAPADDFAEILDKMETALTEKQFGTFMTRLTAWNKIIETSKIFDEIGRDGVASFSGPSGQLHAMAVDLQTKDSKLSYSQAYTRVLEQNPELYKRYRAEQEGK